MLKDTLTAKRVEVECARKRLWVSANSLREKNNCVAPRDVETFKHGVGEDILSNLASIGGKVAMICEGIQARARSTCCKV